MNKLRFQDNLFLNCLNLLQNRDKRLLAVYAVTQVSLVLLDLFGVVLIGAIAATATSAVQGRPLPEIVTTSLAQFGLENNTPQEIAGLLAVIATISLLGKSFLSFYFNYRNFKFLASREATIANSLADLILSQQVTYLQRFTTPQYLHSLNLGVNSVFVGILGGSIVLASEITLQLVMSITLLYLSPALFFLFAIYFGLIFLILNVVLSSKARIWSTQLTETSIEISKSLIDSLGSFREITVSGRRSFFIDRFRKAKNRVAETSAKTAMLGQFSKYVFESSFIVGGVAFAAYAFFTFDAIEAASLLAIFIAAGSRIAPSMLKLQLGIMNIKGAIGASKVFFEIYEHLLRQNSNSKVSASSLPDPIEGIVIDNLTFSYPETNAPALEKVTCKIERASFTAIVGPSGSGKSTLIDLILGVLKPTCGAVQVFGLEPSQLLGSGVTIGYVPQSVYLLNGTIAENICFGIEREQYDTDRIWKVVSQVALADWVNSLPDGLDTLVGESGAKVSGGQRQRLGIARALYADPVLLVLDEATSSLDSLTELEIAETMRNLKPELTKIVIAHRLSTVKSADKLIYIHGGKLIAVGNFQELRESVPDFDKQAVLMGIQR